MYKLSDVVRHQHNFFYQLSIVKQNAWRKAIELPEYNYKEDLKTLINDGSGSFDPFYRILNYSESICSFESFKDSFEQLVNFPTATAYFKSWAVHFIKDQCQVNIPRQFTPYRSNVKS